MAGPRVVSLVPSITETLLAWGITPVGVTRFCEAPGVAQMGGTKNPAIEAIVAIRPDVVVVDKEENRKEDAEALGGAGLTVVATDVRSVADVGPALDLLAAASGIQRPPCDGRAGEADEQAGPGQRAKVSAFVPVWRRPWMTIGRHTYGTSILHAAGLENVYGDSEEPYPQIEIGDAVSRKADYVLAPSEPYEFKERHRSELEIVAPLLFVDGQDLFWWGARTPFALRRLTELAATLHRG